MAACANLALICGQVGRPGAGLWPLRGQNNVQGACDMGALAEFYPGYQRVDDPQAAETFRQPWEPNLKSNIWVVLVEDRFAVPLSCRHCEKAPCVTACYTEALISAEDGTIAFDAAKCTGCGLCLFACPFAVVGFDWSGKAIHKCDLCAERLAKGKPPACVVTCPTQALRYDEYEAFTQEAKRRAALEMVRAMAPSSEKGGSPSTSLRTGPTVLGVRR